VEIEEAASAVGRETERLLSSSLFFWQAPNLLLSLSLSPSLSLCTQI
jgi:hypothetical protein